MNELIYGCLIIALIAVVDRLREVVTFPNYFNYSIFTKLIKNHFKLYKWFRSWDKDEFRHITIWGIKIPLHPICWDFYHFSKNITFVILIIVHVILTVWWIVIPDAIIIYLMQTLILKIMVKK